MRKKNKITLILVAAICVLVAVGAWSFRGGDVQYRTVPAQQGDVNVAVSATGNPNAVVTVQVGSQVSGTVVALFADFNTKVKKGELIARIDPAPFQARVDQAQASLDAAHASVANAEAVEQQAMANIQSAASSLAAAKANVVKAQAAVDDAKSKVDRRVTMVANGSDSKEDLETAQTTYKSSAAELDAVVAQEHAAEETVKAAQAQLNVAKSLVASNEAQVKQNTAALEATKLDLQHTKIVAPVDGVVVARNVDVGQTVAASLAAPTLFQIAQDLTKMQVDTNVSEADVGRVQVGQPATFTVDAYPGRVFKGVVTSIRKAPINVANVITYDAVIGVSNEDLALFPGMTANVKIVVSQRKNVLRVPNAALRYHPASETVAPAAASQERKGTPPEKSVWTLDAHKHEQQVVVTTGETDGTFTEITGGNLKDGNPVIIAALGNAKTSVASDSAPRPGTGRGRGPGF
jgi:HlyD family secretion protein